MPAVEMPSILATTRLLIADDYPGVAESIAELIEAVVTYPVDVRVAHDGQEALRIAIDIVPHCVFLDIDMPLLDGPAAAMAIREALTGRLPLLVGMSADASQTSTLRCRKAFDSILIKPLRIAVLSDLLSHARLRYEHDNG